jgi:nucleoside-diphosphate-sugar epimerase
MKFMASFADLHLSILTELIIYISKPNGTPRKVLNVDKIKSLGWEPKIGLREGIEKTYEWYKANG